MFTRVITDHSYRFDEIAPGYEGGLFLEIVPLSFTVRVREGLPLNQLRLSVGRSSLPDEEIHQTHQETPLLFEEGAPVRDIATAGGLFLGSRAALEVRAHDVPFMIEHGQRVCKLTFEKMLEPPTVLYGRDIGSSYQNQQDTLGKHFRKQVS